MATQNASDNKAEDFYKPYEEYSKTLRTWLVSYGIGAPVLFLSNEKLTEKLTKFADARCVVIFFLAGLSLQIVLAILNKNLMWIAYYGEIKESFKQGCLYKAADWISRKYWIDILFDAATLFLFFTATYKIFNLVFS